MELAISLYMEISLDSTSGAAEGMSVEVSLGEKPPPGTPESGLGLEGCEII